MNLQSTLNHLEACLVEEIQKQNDSVAWVESLEKAIAANASVEFEALVANGAEVCRASDVVSRRRKELVAQLAGYWKIPATALTLGGVVRRAEGRGARLGDLRGELRAAVATVMKRQRRLASLIGMHRRINADVMQIMLGCETQDQVKQGGSLINAEA
jgi:hypothetical protein